LGGHNEPVGWKGKKSMTRSKGTNKGGGDERGGKEAG